MNLSLSLELTRARRRLLRSPGFSLSVIVLVALSIGGVAAVATAGWSLFARPLPYPQAEQLVTLSAWSHRFNMHMGLSGALVEELNEDGEFGRVALVGQPFDLRLRDGIGWRAVRTDHRLMEVLGLSPLAGRSFERDDTAPGAEPVALIGERTWRRQFGADPGVLGRRLEFDDGAARIVGIAPDHLAIPEAGTQLWLPADLGPDVTSPQMVAQLGSLTIVGRIPDGASSESMQQRLRARFDADPRLQTLRGMLEAEYRARPLRSLWADGQEEGLMILGTATLVVLMAAWLNIAGLWLARWTGRDHELAIQSALGGSRGTALIGVMLEYLVLAVPGGLFALAVAAVGIELFYGLGVLQENGPLRASVAAPTWAFGFSLVIVGAIPVLIALVWQTRKISARAGSFLGGRGISAQAGGAALRKALMVGQIAIAFSLLISLGLLLSSWMNLLDEDLGFEKSGLVAAQVLSPAAGTPSPDAGVEALVDRLRAMPGVEAASWANVVPFGRMEMLSSIQLEERPDDPVPARPRLVGPDFFRVAGIELLAGRRFGPEDESEAVATVIVDRSFQDRYMGGEALGRRFGLADGPDSHADVTIVGVVESVRHMSPDEQLAHPTIYTHSPSPQSQVQLLVRSSMAPATLAGDVRRIIEAELGADRLDFVSTLDSLVRRTVRDREPQLVLVATFGGLALLLVFYGLYALQSYQVTSTTAEIGLRKAMGATDGGILARILVGSFWLLPLGLVIGFPGAWLSMRLIGDRLYEASLLDAWLWLAVAGALSATVLLASLIPALRATRIQPLEALRYG